MDLGLADRVYILTGASRGLGYATAESLVADGARVVISARDQSTVDKAVAGLGGTGPDSVASGGGLGGGGVASAGGLGGTGRAVGVAADLGDPGAAERLVSVALERFGRLDGALISVGGPPAGTALSVTDEQWLAAFQTVFLGAVRAARTVAGALGDGGAIAFVLSTSVRVPIANLAISNGLRPGLAAVAKDMADELGPRGIRVLSLLPGRIGTQRSHDLLAATGDPERAKAGVEAAIPLRRIADPAEFGRVAAFALSPAASYLTGVALPVDGGLLRSL